MSGYTPGEFSAMQKEAEKRVMEMQKKAKTALTPPEPPQKRNFLEMLNLRSFFEGKDTSLVLMVLALLNSEDTDPVLLLALLYVIL